MNNVKITDKIGRIEARQQIRFQFLKENKGKY
ncbi:hypothetical protein Clocel_2297 [Clostridium cellulovorans 743B]|uniref:Uncharacterized protein n=1 Tax=Clostridium cellulovorans (strain ATCC 35296 / DSM 3052 / OCM 3 / 743B) TaxID=573061 RepID=D9SP58_CLOC7|nr:hypothetical protein Clocel_2297 [Clostridium cellulovorans 743B]